jgi:hypothetical protein
MVAVNVGHEHVVDIGWLEADGLESLAQFRLARVVRRARVDQNWFRPLEEVGGDVFRWPGNVELEAMDLRESVVGSNGAASSVGSHYLEKCDPAS